MNATQISILLNIFFVILILVYFFKDALNKLLFHKIKSNEEEKKEERENLKKLRTLLNEYYVAFGNFAVFGTTYFKGSIESAKYIEPSFKEWSEKFTSIQNQLVNLKPDLDASIRDKLDKLMANVGTVTLVATGMEKIVKDIKSMTQDEFIKELTSTQRQCLEFINYIENKINK